MKKHQKLICPKCGSTAVWQEVSVVARAKLNATKMLPYFVETNRIDNQFEDACGCSKCGWEGTLDEIYEATDKAKCGADKKCVNCSHNIRTHVHDHVEYRCELDHHWISYSDSFEHSCNNWKKDHKFDGKLVEGSGY